MSAHVLVVEDDQAIQEIITIVLTEAGHTVTALSNGNALEETIKSKNPSLIFLDLTLPGMEGKHVAKKLKQHKSFRSIPLILLSGISNIKEITEESGANGYLEKPFNVEELLAMVEKYKK